MLNRRCLRTFQHDLLTALLFCRHLTKPAFSRALTTSRAHITGSSLDIRRAHTNRGSEDANRFVPRWNRFMVCGQVFKIKFHSLSRVLGRLFNRGTVGNAARKHRNENREAPLFLGNLGDLVGVSLFQLAYKPIVPEHLRIARP